MTPFNIFLNAAAFVVIIAFNILYWQFIGTISQARLMRNWMNYFNETCTFNNLPVTRQEDGKTATTTEAVVMPCRNVTQKLDLEKK